MSVSQRCRVALENDTRALARLAIELGGCAVTLAGGRGGPREVARDGGERLRGRLDVEVLRFGDDHVREIRAVFPSVRTAFCDLRGTAAESVVVCRATVEATITPQAGEHDYPLAPPQVRLRYPGRPPQLAPFLGGLFFSPSSGPLPSFVQALAGLVGAPLAGLGGDGGEPAGIPCLWRPGAWGPDRDLRWVVCQVHRLLVVDPTTRNAATDSMNPPAAEFWSHQARFVLPLEGPLVPAEERPRAARPALRLRRVS